MFDNFNAVFVPDAQMIETETVPVTHLLSDMQLQQLIALYGGKSFNQGLYRVGTLRDIVHWRDLVLSAFPVFSERITCFGMDWLGRIFSLDSSRLEENRPGVVMFEPGTAQALEIPCNLESFHENELIQYKEEALAESFYQEWLTSGGSVPALMQCVGYKKPLFLGGADTVDNLEISDLDVYWTIAAQIIQKIKALPPGTSISKTTIT